MGIGRLLPRKRGAGGAIPAVLICLSLLTSLLALPAASQEQQTREPCPPDQTSQAPQPWTPAPECIDVQIMSPIAASTKVSDKFDGRDSAFRITATVSHPPEDAEIEVFVAPTGGQPSSLGPMTRVAPDSDTWEFFWTVPDSEARGARTLSVVLSSGGAPIADDSMTIDLAHKGTPQSGSTCGVPGAPGCTPATLEAETATITWPLQDGDAGFFRGTDGRWRTVIDAVSSPGATAGVKLYYSISAIGLQPSFTECGTAASVVEGEHRVARGICLLGDGLLPSLVTAIAAVPSTASLESGDVVRVHPYIQDTDSMSLSLSAMDPATITRTYPAGSMRRATSGCLRYSAKVVDDRGRPVAGANIDARITGPGDVAAFGSAAEASAFGAPSNLTSAAASTCAGLGNSTSKQGVAANPDGPDAVHIESTLGTGLSGPAGVEAGEWRFLIYGGEPGRTQIEVWLDDERIAREVDLRADDDDMPEPGEQSATAVAQWFLTDIQVAITPLEASVPTWGCAEHKVIVQAGGTKLENLNIDLHARGPNNDIAFCSLPGHEPVRAPDGGDHKGPETRDGIGSSHPASHAECGGTSDTLGIVCRHAEGETNTQGELVFGLVSGAAGDSSIEAWVEGDPGARFDVDTRSTVIRNTAATSWVRGSSDVRIRLISPSTFTGGTGLASTPIPGPTRVTARVDNPAAVEQVEVLLGSGGSFELLGYAQQIGLTDTWEFDWDLTDAAGGDVSDGTYDLAVRLVGTNQSASRSITINRTPSSLPTTAGKAESARITVPSNGAPLAFKEGVATIEGIASPGAEGADIYYSIARPRQGTISTNNIVWQSAMCGYVDLLGTGSQEQPFVGNCKLASGHSPTDVVAISVITYDCSLRSGCDADPNPKPIAGGQNSRPRQGENAGASEGGEAIRVRGCGGAQCAWFWPETARRATGECHVMWFQVYGADGLPLSDVEVDVEASGPTENLTFCDPPSSEPQPEPVPSPEPSASDLPATPRSAETKRLELRSGADGSVLFGVSSPDSSFSSIYSTVESGHTTVKVWPDLDGDNQASAGETVLAGRIHWDLEGRCTLVGTDRDDSLAGTVDDDKICTLDGIDEVIAQEGADMILAGPGNDILVGDEGDDVLFGESGIDEIEGGQGSDEIYGGGGSDRLVGQAGADLIVGGRGRDICIGGKGRDTFIGCEVIKDLDKKDSVRKKVTEHRKEVPPNVI